MEQKKNVVIEQLDEALEERQNPDRRKIDLGFHGHAEAERRKGDRRKKDEASND
ncbi:hypothetical protein [Halioxenophilus aromaticivorans]|uniref:Uncharacterized protein n=1 Tax=Halioxenophilus aromaticivorans TaxID=1306992 RepID=A0AAV3U1G0_9ALTE